MSSINGVKKLSLPYTSNTGLLDSYIREQQPTQTPIPPRNPTKEAYDSLTDPEKQGLSNAENTLFEVKRRAIILLEREQRQSEDAQASVDKVASGYNKPFNPSPAQIKTKFNETLTPEELALIQVGISAKTKWKTNKQTIIDAIEAANNPVISETPTPIKEEGLPGLPKTVKEVLGEL